MTGTPPRASMRQADGPAVRLLHELAESLHAMRKGIAGLVTLPEPGPLQVGADDPRALAVLSLALVMARDTASTPKTYAESLASVTLSADGLLLVPDPRALIGITGDARTHLERGLNPWDKSRGWNIPMQDGIRKSAPELAARLASLAGGPPRPVS